MSGQQRISEAELLAYVDGQLGTDGRVAVEAHLRDHAELASQVLEDLRLRDELRLFLAEEDWPAPPRSVGLARELTRKLHRRSLGVQLRRVAVAAALVALGWFAHAEFDLFVDQVAASPTVPAYADEATEAYQAMRVLHDSGRVRDGVLLSLPAPQTGGEVPTPTLGGGLRLLGSDLVPWDGGVALVALYDAGGGRLVTLFAAEAGSFAVDPPRAATVQGLPTVFWQHGRFAYALNGDVPQARLLDLAGAAAALPWTGPIDHPRSLGGTHG
jgi:anti-sigma factor RsiW